MKFLRPTALLLLFAGVAPGQESSAEHYGKAEALLAGHNYRSAIAEFQRALDGDLDPPGMEARAHLGLGGAFDTIGECDRAGTEYQLGADFYNAALDVKNEAEAYLKLRGTGAILTLPEGVRRQGYAVTDPEPLQTRQPEYSLEARLAGLEGNVAVAAVIDPAGVPRNIRVLQPLGLGLDAKAVEAVSDWRFKPGRIQGVAVPVLITAKVWFGIPEKESRWHLVEAAFRADEGTSRPEFARAPYPPGAGVRKLMLDEGQIIAAIHRFAGVTLAFDVDEHGMPQHIKVMTESAPNWGNEALAVFRNWRFKPAVSGGVPVQSAGLVNLFWGAHTLPAEAVKEVKAGWFPQSPGSRACRGTAVLPLPVNAVPNPLRYFPKVRLFRFNN